MTRKIIQITTEYFGENYMEPSCVLALCDDGTVWRLNSNETDWKELPNIPQDEIDYKAIAETEGFKKPEPCYIGED